jgi:hypothetical protein
MSMTHVLLTGMLDPFIATQTVFENRSVGRMVMQLSRLKLENIERTATLLRA